MSVDTEPLMSDPNAGVNTVTGAPPDPPFPLLHPAARETNANTPTTNAFMPSSLVGLVIATTPSAEDVEINGVGQGRGLASSHSSRVNKGSESALADAACEAYKVRKT